MNPKNLSGKLDEIRKILSGRQLDIIGITETWLKPYISNKSVSVHNYKIYRNDRIKKRGGGVASLKVSKLGFYQNKLVVLNTCSLKLYFQTRKFW